MRKMLREGTWRTKFNILGEDFAARMLNFMRQVPARSPISMAGAEKHQARGGHFF
jgi:hypothetical protein